MKGLPKRKETFLSILSERLEIGLAIYRHLPLEFEAFAAQSASDKNKSDV